MKKQTTAIALLAMGVGMVQADTLFATNSSTDFRVAANWTNGFPTAVNPGTMDGAQTPTATWIGDGNAADVFHFEMINGAVLKKGDNTNNEFRGDIRITITDGTLEANPVGVTARSFRLKNTSTITLGTDGSFL